jgi:hypothetical protein
MSQLKKFLLSLAILAAIACGVHLGRADAAGGGGDILCSIDVTVESRTQTGLVVGTEEYHNEFVLREGVPFSDDFSTATRSKTLDASLASGDGEKTVSVDWFADVTVFNTVDLRTSVTLEDGDKRGKAVGDNTVFTSSGSTRTLYTLTCVED